MLAIDAQRVVAKFNLVKQLYFLPEVTSTMTKAWDIVRSLEGRKCDGIMVIALAQTQGRGRQGRSWESPAGKGLLLSLILQDRSKNAQAADHATLSARVPVAVCHGLRKFLDCGIKYPNDIVADGRKLSGILVERKTVAESPVANVGIGINVGQTLDELPQGTVTPPTSLFLETGRMIPLDRVLDSICESMEYWLREEVECYVQPEINNLCETLGKQVLVETGNGILTGKAISITNNASLELETTEGRKYLGSGNIVRLHYEVNQTAGRLR